MDFGVEQKLKVLCADRLRYSTSIQLLFIIFMLFNLFIMLAIACSQQEHNHCHCSRFTLVLGVTPVLNQYAFGLIGPSATRGGLARRLIPSIQYVIQ